MFDNALPKWGRWAKKLWCASDPPIPADCRLEDRMRTRVFSPTYPTWDFKASQQNCTKYIYWISRILDLYLINTKYSAPFLKVLGTS